MLKKSKVIAQTVFVATMMLSSISCVSISAIRFSQDRQTAVDATNRFHNLFNEQKFEEIYEVTDNRARETKSKETLISILANLRNERGRVISSDLIDSQIEVRSTYREVRETFRTKFERIETVEKFTWYISSNKAGLFSYETE